MSARRVVITGVGVVSPLGRGLEAQVQAIRDSRSGIRPLGSLEPSDEAKDQWIGGSVDEEWIEASRHDRTTRLALTAAADAIDRAGLDGDPVRRGVVIGTGLGGAETMERAYHRLYRKGSSRLPPMTIPAAMYNAPTSAISSAYEAHGPAWSVVSACTSSNHALAQALDWIRAGRADVVIAGGADAPLQPGIIHAWEALRVLAPAGNDPGSACRPFSTDRAGIVLAEGAAVFILEAAEHAERRGAATIAELLGAGISSDAGHVTDPTVEGPAAALRLALEDAGVAREEIEYINAHGTATRANDPLETKAIRQVFGAHANRLAVSSTKSLHGHAMGASGAIELAMSLASLRETLLPPTAHLETPDPECDLDYVPQSARTTTARTFVSNSFGFGGLNGCIVVRVNEK